MSSSGLIKSSQAFRTIAEASDELTVPAHVLRFWEGKFTQLKPLKRAGGRRHYRPDDMALLRGIRALLHEDGYQLKGVQKLLRDQGIAWVRDRGQILGPKTMEDDSTHELQLPLHERASPELSAQSGPLFAAANSNWDADNVGPTAAILLRKALVKLEKANHLLDEAVRIYAA